MEGEQRHAPSLSGMRVLVVEDEMLLMMMLRDILEELGCTVRTAAHLEAATVLAQEEPFDGAVLDVNLAGETVYPVAQILQRRDIPFVFSTGYGDGSLPVEYRDYPVLSKPYLPETVKNVLESAAR